MVLMYFALGTYVTDNGIDEFSREIYDEQWDC